MVNKMNIASLFARSYVDAVSVATGPLSAKTARTRTQWAEARSLKEAAAAFAVKKMEAGRQALDARW